jgi:C-terminal processing protease CtpA/Prc
MCRLIFIQLLCLFAIHAFSQSGKEPRVFNLGFEQIKAGNKLSDGWFKWGTDDFNLKVDSSVKHSGNVSLLIEASKDITKNSFGCVALGIPADYLGKEIEVRAYMHSQDVADNEIGLLLRIDDKNRNVLEMENGRQRNLQGAGSWGYCSVSVPFPPKAKTIYIGATLSGHGKLWVDDFQVLIDGKDISKAKQKARIELKADRDHEFDNASGISLIALTPEKRETLYLLGKIWGFLKYYHPAIAKGNYNWDYELFRILPKLMEINDQKQRNAVLYTWINDLGAIQVEKPIKLDSAIVKVYPDLSWLRDTASLGTELVTVLEDIKNSKRSDDHYYIDLTKGVGTPEFTNENAHDTVLYPDIGFQLLALYRYWNSIQYYYPYKYLIEENWDNALKEYIPRFINSSTELEYKLAVLSLIGRIHDSNANIMAPNPVVTAFKGNNRAPVDISFVENKAVVTGSSEKNKAEMSQLKPGDVVLKVNGKNTEEIIKERLEYTPASNYTVQLRNIGVDLLRTNDTLIQVTYQRADSIKTGNVKCYSRDWLYKLKNRQKKDTCFRFSAPEILYIYTGSLKNIYLEKALPVLFKTKGIIIDLRCYPSESIVSSLGNYLVPELTPFAKYTTGNRNVPGLFTFSENKMIGGESRRHYKGKVVVLVNEQTQGAAEYHAMAFRTAPGVTIIGSTTAGANGNLSDIYLPGGIRTLISSLGIYYPDGRETQRVGIQPHIIVLPTVKGISEGRDELVEKAIELINGK